MRIKGIEIYVGNVYKVTGTSGTIHIFRISDLKSGGRLYRVGCNGKIRLPSLLKSIFPHIGKRRKTKITILLFLIMNKQDFVTHMSENGMTSDNAIQMYNHLNERFDGDWKQAAAYLENMVSYLQNN